MRPSGQCFDLRFLGWNIVLCQSASNGINARDSVSENQPAARDVATYESDLLGLAGACWCLYGSGTRAKHLLDG